MKKDSVIFLFSILAVSILLMLTGCQKDAETSELPEDTSSDTVNISENSEEPISVSFAYIVGKDAEQSKIDLPSSDANTVISIFDSANWAPSAAKCLDEYEMWLGNEMFYYHSECGTVNDRTNDRSFCLTDTQREDINKILQSYPATNDNGVLQLPDNLPTNLAISSDINGEGGYLLLGKIPEENIAIYCDNSVETNQVYI